MFHVPLEFGPTPREEEIYRKMRDAARDGDLPRLRQEFERWNMLKDEELKPPGRMAPRWPRRVHPELSLVSREIAMQGNSEVMGYLLNMGLGFEPGNILRAARRCHWGVIKTHMDCGWRIDDCLRYQEEPPLLGYALGESRSIVVLKVRRRRLIHKEEVVRGLLQLGADPKANYGDRRFDLPHLAGQRASPAVMELFREHGVDFVKTNALHAAAHREGDLQIDTMTYLLDEVGVPIDRLAFQFKKENQLWIGCCCGSVLHCAVSDGNMDKVEFLAGRGADPNLGNEDGRSPFDVAREKGFEDAIRIFEEIKR